jgi:DNA-binding NtrC family response regulator
MLRNLGSGLDFSHRSLLASLRHQWPRNFDELLSSVAAATLVGSRRPLEPADLRLPEEICREVGALSDQDCERELLHVADAAVRQELTRSELRVTREVRIARVAEILGESVVRVAARYETHRLD